MKRSLRDKYNETVVRQYKETKKKEYKKEETKVFWGNLGYYIPFAAYGWVVGTILGYLFVGYFVLKIVMACIKIWNGEV